MKKFLSILVVLSLVLSIMASAVTADATPTITVSDVSGKAGDTVTVDFYITDMEIITMDLTITYDSTVMKLTEIQTGDTEFEMFMGYAESGKVTAFSYSKNVEATGTLLKATFLLLQDAAPGEYTVGAADIMIYDPENNLVDFAVVEGEVAILDTPTVPTITVSDVSGKAGDTVTVDFYITDMEIITMDLTITYDSTVMKLTEIQTGDTEFEMFMGYAESGKVTAFSYSKNVEATGTLLKATFLLLQDAAPGEYTVGATDIMIYDPENNLVDFAVVDGTITVEAAPHTHEFGEVTYEWAADYSAYTATRACACGHTETAHATVTSKVTNPTCDDAGYTTYTATFTEEWAEDATKRVPGDPATGHTYGEVTYTWNADNSACTATRVCACGHTETANATVTSKVTGASCTEAGTVTYTATFAEDWAETQTKTVAGDPATGHTYGEVTYTWNADNSSCTATRACACGHTETATASVSSKTTAATCTEAGTVTYTATFAEDWAETQTKTVAGDPATGHTYGEVTYTWSADNSACTATRACACGHTETANATVNKKVNVASCTEAGTVTYTATFAEDWAETQTKTVAGDPAAGHTYGEVTYTWNADNSACTATRACACGHTETATASVSSKTTAATCTEAGSVTYTATFAEDWAETQTKTVAGDPATGHTYGEVTYTWNADNSACTATHACACGHTETATASVSSKTTAATCTEAGSVTYTATFTESWAETQTKTAAGDPATGHTYGEVIYTWNEDNTVCTATRTCACGHTETATATVSSETTAPSCTEAGTVTYTTTFAEDWAQVQTKTVTGDPATGHVDADNDGACDDCSADLSNAKTGDTVLAVIAAAVISALSIVALPVIKKRF